MINLKRTILITILILAFCMQGLILWGCDNFDEEVTFEEKVDCFTRDWMDYIDDNAQINEIVMPGSHDACSYGMHLLAETQSRNIYQQLCGGVRYFDIRIKRVDGVLVAYHSIVNGVAFNNIVADIKSFIGEYPSQFLILDFKISGSVQEEMAAILINELDFPNNALKTDENIINLTMGDIRNRQAKYIALFDSSIPVGYEQYIHPRGQSLISPYHEDYNVLRNGELILQGFPEYFAQAKSNDKLFVLQAQRTADVIISPRELENQFKPYINDYLANITAPEILNEINIVMRDFINDDIDNIKLILILNDKKSTINPDLLEEFLLILQTIE